MAAHPCATPVMQRPTSYQVLTSQYSYPVQQYQHQQQYQPYMQQPPFSNAVIASVQNPTNLTVPQQNSTVNIPSLIDIPLRKVTPEDSLGKKFPIGRGLFLINNQLFTTGNNSAVLEVNGGQNMTTDSNMSQTRIVQNTQIPQTNIINAGIQSNEEKNVNKNNNKTGYFKPKPPDNGKKTGKEIPELTQVQVNPDQTEKIGSLKIELSGSFMSWNIAGKTILDLNFMRNVFCITNLDLIFERVTPYESGLCEGLNRLVQNKLLTDWLVLKCEGKQIPLFKVNNLIELHSANNFITLLNTIAQDSCLPLPLITRNGQKEKYYYINFPKGMSDRVRKLNVPVFHDADNGRKRISCKYPGIRLDCNFENAIQKFDIHVHASATAAFEECITSVRQVIIYKHIVWGFLQAWTRKIREHFNGCFKIQDIVKNLCLCVGNPTRPDLDQDNELVYYIDYSNFYLTFDPVRMKDTTTTFSIQNFETNYVCDVSIVQYYRQFFLINDMHYSDALKNLVVFSEENGANRVTDFVYAQPKSNNSDNSKVGFSPPGGINRTTTVHRPVEQIPPTITPRADVSCNNTTTKHRTQQTYVPAVSATVSKPNWNEKTSNSHKASPNNEQILVRPVPPKEISRPLIKARTVEEINSSIDRIIINPKLSNANLSSEASKDQLVSRPPKLDFIKSKMNVSLSPYTKELLNNCYARHAVEITQENLHHKTTTFHEIFNHAMGQAMKMTTVDDFVDKMYTTLQKSYTNLICQSIMDRTITRLLSMRFPSLKDRLQPVQTPKEPATTPPQGVSPQKMRKTCGQGQNFAKISQPNKDRKDNSEHDVECISLMPKSSEQQQQTQPQSPKAKSWLDHSYTKNAPKETESAVKSQASPAINATLTPTPQSSSAVEGVSVEESPPSVESLCEVNNEINLSKEELCELRKSNEKQKTSPEREENPVNDIYETQAKVNVIEKDDSVSIHLTLPVSTKYKDNLSGEGTPKTVSLDTSVKGAANRPRQESSACERRKHISRPEESNFRVVETENESLKSSLNEKELFRKFKLKHCTVVVNAKDVTNSLEKQNRERKRRRIDDTAPVEENMNIPNISFDNNKGDESSLLCYPSSRRKSKGVSELELMEAKTRVLQRLRKRNYMNVFGYSSQVFYSDAEINRFIRSSRSRSKSDLSIVSERKDNQDEKYQILYRECLTKKAKVVLSRIDDVKEDNNEKIKWKVKTNADGSLTITKDRTAEYENIPKNKRRFFEMKDGKLYLKEKYQVKNGEIVLAKSDTRENNMNLKRESEPSPSVVKVEISE